MSVFTKNGIIKTAQEMEQALGLSEDQSWTIRYTAILDDGGKLVWEQECGWQSEDHEASAGNLLLSMKLVHYGLVSDGVFYPPHRVREVTWKIS